MFETTARPTSVAWDRSLTYPPPLAKVIKEYETAHTAWVSEYAELAACEARIPKAEAEDAAALTTAVAAGKPDDPGAGRADKARRAAVVANERTAQARERATAETDTLRATLAAAGPELVPLVLASINAAVDSYETALAETQRRVRDEAAHLQDSFAGVRMLTPILRDYGLPGRLLESAIEAPTWPSNPLATVRSHLARIEAAVERKAAPAIKAS